MNVKKVIKENPVTSDMFQAIKRIRNAQKQRDRLRYKGIFKNRAKGCDKLCIVLAGYKEFLYPAVFGRLKRYLSNNIDVCIITSGLFSEKVDILCKKNKWSYLSTKENNVSLVQNVAINLHPNADFIFKLDEDMFITENYFDKMIEAYEECENTRFTVGVLAPLIPLNGYAHLRLLKKLNLVDIYEKKFERALYKAGPTRQIETNPDVAKFFWGEGGYIPAIDELNEKFSEEKYEITACPIRFSIGAILFKRKLWEDMGYFSVDRSTTAMGLDEKELVEFCCSQSRPVMVAENIVVGHFSFGPQTAEMKKYYKEHPKNFMV